ncbi:GTPase [Desulfosarcina sp.]|uniref:GTPase n=1 Tax=Desulfosarcina sp. TaxID=2027861 RepID=UPI0039705D77
MMDAQMARLRAMGALETIRTDILGLAETLAGIPLWRPAAGLRKACEEALVMLGHLVERFDRKLVVTLVGPSGSGKSTLLNALAGEDNLSPSGHRRPTTERVVVVCRRSTDAGQLVDKLGPEDVRVHFRAAVEALENIILIDTPDTDSTHQDRHIPIIHKAIGLSDVLVCVFDGENPKRRDHTDFLAPYVRLFSGESLVVAVNKCDRLAEAELSETIMPEFSRYIREAWSVEPAAVLCVSARSHLRQPGWDPEARPKHDRNQFDQLRQMVVGTFNQPGFSVDRRLDNARSLWTYLQQSVRTEAQREVERLHAATAKMAATEAEAMQQAVAAFRGDGVPLTPGINVRLYQQLSQRWLGPVGWLVALWTRILVFGTGIASLLRFGNPVRQIVGAVSAVRHLADSKKSVDAADRGTGAGMALLRYDSTIARTWPDIAEMLIKSRFAPAVREAGRAPGYGEEIGQHLSRIWNDALEAELAQAGRRLSGGLLQLVFNLPVLAVLGYTGWLTALNFFSGSILSGDFFLHAFWTIVLVLLLSFFLLQGVIRLAAGKERLLERVFARVREAVDQGHNLAGNAVWQQANLILGLGGSGN